MNGPSPPPPPPPGPGPASTFTGDSRADVAQLPTEQLEKLLSDEEAFKAFARAWLQSTGVGAAPPLLQGSGPTARRGTARMQGLSLSPPGHGTAR